MNKELQQIKELLDIKYELYNREDFIPKDPISIPHLFDRKEDIEIAGFMAAILAWGQRATILNKATELLRIMDFSPYEFITHSNSNDLKALKTYRHRTFSGIDAVFFIQSLQNIYLNHGGLELAFSRQENEGIKQAIMNFRQLFFSLPHPERAAKHIADPSRGSAAKRINMFLRWMVRKDERGVDFGIWDSVPASDLYCPLDLHTGNVARKLGLISRKQNDWKALEELMAHLRSFDPHDPVKYDFALFGMGIHKNF